MSTDETGDRAVVGEFVRQAKDLVEAAREPDPMQLDMLDPVTPEEMAEARERLGPQAGRLSVLRDARDSKRGRPPGARNKRTDDFARYILSFGQHPAVTMMQIQATPPEILIQASEQPKVHSFQRDGTANIVTERLTYAEAQSLRIRCAEGLLPYLESKKPVAVDMTFSGISDLIIAGETHSDEEVRDILEAEFAEVGDVEPDDDGAEP